MIPSLHYCGWLMLVCCRAVNWLSVASLVLFIATSAAGQDKGIDPALLAKAKAGDAVAEFQVGLNYEDGEGVSQDFTKAAVWYRKAAEQEDARAQYYLGCLYLFESVPPDYARGVTWFRKAAEQGYSASQTDLARFYLTGKYVPQDYALAVSWYRKAAERGNPDGQSGLASLYEDGQGVTQNYSEAYFWISLAAANPELAGVIFLSPKNTRSIATALLLT